MRRLVVLATLAPALAGCVATAGQVTVLQEELRAMRSEAALRDSLSRQRLRALDSVRTEMAVLRDSLADFRRFVTRSQGQILGDLGTVQAGLIEVRSLTGMSQSRIVELRAELEQRNTLLQQGAAPAGAAPASTPPAGATTAAPASPGPSQLYTMALDQLRRGSTGAARAGFTDFLAQYPQHEQAGDAQYYLAETLEREKKDADAEAAYLAAYSKYPASLRAPTAMFKRAQLLGRQGKAARAKEVLEALVKAYPRSDEAELARDRLKG